MAEGYSIIKDKKGEATMVISYPGRSYRDERRRAAKKQNNVDDPDVKFTVTKSSLVHARSDNRKYEILRLPDERRVFVSRTSSKKDVAKNISHLEVANCYGNCNKQIIEKYILAHVS